jgi:hypothetical protein
MEKNGNEAGSLRCSLVDVNGRSPNCVNTTHNRSVLNPGGAFLLKSFSTESSSISSLQAGASSGTSPQCKALDWSLVCNTGHLTTRNIYIMLNLHINSGTQRLQVDFCEEFTAGCKCSIPCLLNCPLLCLSSAIY